MRTTKIIWILFVVTFMARLGLGWFALNYLPTLETGSEPQQAGYLFYDAFHRDSQAFDLAASDAPLWSAFSQKQSSDQYGGMLWLLAFLYRIFPVGHNPLVPLTIIALFGAMGVGFFYPAISHFTSSKTALIATAAFALYPESILLGASQMREPLLITLAALTLATFANIDQKNSKTWLSAALVFLFSLAISPGIALLFLTLAGGWFILDRMGDRVPLKKILLFGTGFIVMVLVAGLVLVLSWEKIGDSVGFGVFGEWVRRTTAYNAHLLKQSSGIVQVVVGSLPSIFVLPFVIVYGSIQPVLPAVFFEPGEIFWKVIGSLRSIGWYGILPLFLSFPFFLDRKRLSNEDKKRLFVFSISLLWILFAAARGGGDQWDNPRYRTILLPMFLFIAAIVWEKFQTQPNIWLKKIFWVEISSLLIFTHWYSWRYAGIGFNFGIRNTILIAITVALLITFSDSLLRMTKRKLRL